MTLREITIGRSKDSDIYLDERCMYASNHHATIYFDGNQLMFRDFSTNGTLINNINVKHRAIPISRGDVIMLAGKYQISWQQIDRFFSQPANPQPQRGMGTMGETPVQQALRAAATPDTSKWNWGAFGLYGLWGFFNGCWWAFLVSLFFGYLFPIPNILFGIYGTRLAWENRKWESARDFESTQSKWAIWGIVITCINIVSIIFVIAFFASLL